MVRAFPNDFRLLLASRSPRRSRLLRDLGVPFTVVESEAEELLSGMAPPSLAETNAGAKAVGARLPEKADGAFVLGTDTIVVVEGRALGKPQSRREAAAMLAELSGRTHEVISGVALLRVGGRLECDHAVTGVSFARLTEEQIGAYLDSGEWTGKAGAYAIQGLAGLLIPRIEGEYANVVGLPIHLLHRLFLRHGFDLLTGSWVDVSGDFDSETGGEHQGG
ncbi:MAG: Maf family protein [Thermoleophilia bacterium]